MADLGLDASPTPVEIVDDSNGNELGINSDKSLTARLKDGGGTSIIVGQKAMSSSVPVVIASDQSTLPITVGLPTYLSMMFGFAAGLNQPTAGSDNPLLYLVNPNGSGKTIYLKFTAYGISVANVLGTLRIYKNPTVSANGTAQTIVSFGSGSTAMSLYAAPTVTSNGSLLYTGVTGQNGNSLNVSFDFEITIAPNSSLLVTGDPGSNNRQAEVSMRWLES